MGSPFIETSSAARALALRIGIGSLLTIFGFGLVHSPLTLASIFDSSRSLRVGEGVMRGVKDIGDGVLPIRDSLGVGVVLIGLVTDMMSDDSVLLIDDIKSLTFS